jgi:hypothetical protein
MRRQLLLMLGVAFMVFTMAACEGDVGPAGPQGPPGDPGDIATISCADCHYNDATLVAVQAQYSEALHWTSDVWTRTGACMECHNHNGFIHAVVNGDALPARFDNPVPINCRTCHEIHTTFTADDYALTTTEPVSFKFGDGVFDQGNGNLCANCHQSRPISPVPAIGGDPITLTAQGGVVPAGNRYGPHYGPQANVMEGASMFEFAGSMSYPTTNPHARDCASCHMVAPAFDGGVYLAGGHKFTLSWGDAANQQLIAACTQCHSGATSFNHLNGRTEIQGLLATLRGLLEAEGIMRAADYYANPGTYDPEVAMAFLNWKFIYHDHSYGTHNPGYARAILTNSIEAMQARLPTKAQLAAN